jgi:hypothetical protein
LMPVFNKTGCCGHILRTAKGLKACDANDRLSGGGGKLKSQGKKN